MLSRTLVSHVWIQSLRLAASRLSSPSSDSKSEITSRSQSDSSSRWFFQTSCGRELVFVRVVWIPTSWRIALLVRAITDRLNWFDGSRELLRGLALYHGMLHVSSVYCRNFTSYSGKRRDEEKRECDRSHSNRTTLRSHSTHAIAFDCIRASVNRVSFGRCISMASN
jgi:hypothetical protein